MTSDTFFIEEIYSSSSLKNTSRYYLVDHFDDETALEILSDEGLSEEEARYAVEWIGGVPWMMEEILDGEDVKAVIRELYDQTLGKVYEVVRGREDLKELLKRTLSGENLYYEEEKMERVKELVEKEALFFDPINRLVKFQTKLDERAAKELIRT